MPAIASNLHFLTSHNLWQTLGNARRLGNDCVDVALTLGVLAGPKSAEISGVVHMMPIRIVIMAKAPVAGFAKTRLIPALGAEGAALLAQKMLHHTLATALASKLGVVEVCATPDPSDPAWQNLDLPNNLCWSSQGNGDLGERMARVAERALSSGECVLLIGTDCPAIDEAILREAAESLQHDEASLLPTFDGGYALIGLKEFNSALFDNMVWSTSTVAQVTLQRLQRLGWKTHVLRKLHDVDEPSDLQYLPSAWGYKTSYQISTT